MVTPTTYYCAVAKVIMWPLSCVPGAFCAQWQRSMASLLHVPGVKRRSGLNWALAAKRQAGDHAERACKIRTGETRKLQKNARYGKQGSRGARAGTGLAPCGSPFYAYCFTWPEHPPQWSIHTRRRSAPQRRCLFRQAASCVQRSATLQLPSGRSLMYVKYYSLLLKLIHNLHRIT